MKKSLFIVLAFMISLSLLTGCGTSSTSTNAESANDTLQRVLENKKVVVGVLPDYAPWGSRNASGNFEGYDVDLAYALGDALNVEVEIVPIEAPNRVPALVSNKIDVLIACITPTNERAKSIDFTIPYAAAGLVPMVRSDNTTINSYKDLAGKDVAVVRGGTPDLLTSKAVPEANLIRFDTIADAYTAFKSGKAEVFVEEDTFVFIETKNNTEYKAIGEPFSTELISFAVKKYDQNWLNYLNNFLTNLRFTGENAEIYQKWFGHEPKSLILE